MSFFFHFSHFSLLHYSLSLFLTLVFFLLSTCLHFSLFFFLRQVPFLPSFSFFSPKRLSFFPILSVLFCPSFIPFSSCHCTKRVPRNRSTKSKSSRCSRKVRTEEERSPTSAPTVSSYIRQFTTDQRTHTHARANGGRERVEQVRSIVEKGGSLAVGERCNDRGKRE